MSKYQLGFISDADLVEHISNIVDKFRSEVNLKSFNKNIIDPIKLTFDSKIYKKTITEIVQSEVLRQIDKSNNNQIGYFHQNIFKYIGGSDWIIPAQGFDIINEKQKIYVEMKNKHNTMNSSSSQKSYMTMQNQIMQDSNSTCLLVEVISKKSQNIPWSISLNSQPIQDNRIRKVSMDNFYEIVTGDSLSFYKLCIVLPKVLDDILSNSKDSIIKNTVIQELKDNYKSKDLLTSLYLLAFDTYGGFNLLK